MDLVTGMVYQCLQSAWEKVSYPHLPRLFLGACVLKDW